jgi:hypothetical protein
MQWLFNHTMKPIFKFYFGGTRFEHQTVGNLKQKKFNFGIIDLRSLKINVIWRKTLNLETLNQGSAAFIILT